MATPTYHTGWGPHRGGFGHHGGSGFGRGGTYNPGRGLILSGNTPSYFGSGQPVSDSPTSGWFSGNSTPVYLAVPSMGTPPSTPPSAATAQPPAPQPGQVAIVVPRS
jgi:hypothetical protein